MASNGNKLSIQISGETVELTKSLKNINTAINQSKYEARDLQKALKFDPGNVDLVVRQVSALDQAASLSALKVDELKAGEVGFMTASIKNISDILVGDTITNKDNPCKEKLPGYKPMLPMVY